MGTCALAVFVPRLADACGALPPGLTQTVPVDGSSYPANAALLFWGVDLSLDAVTVTVDGEPAALVPAPFAEELAALAVTVEPPPQEGQSVVVAGSFCGDGEGCEPVTITYTASAPDLAAPAPIVEESFFAVYDHAEFPFISECGEMGSFDRTLYVHLQQAAPAAGDALTLFKVRWEPAEPPDAIGLQRTVQVPEASAIVNFALSRSLPGDADILSEVCLEVVAVDSAGNAAAPFELCPPCFFREDELPLPDSGDYPPEPDWTEADAVPGSACASATATTGAEDPPGGDATPTTGATGEPGSGTDGPDASGTDSATGGEDDGEKGCACRSDGGGGRPGALLWLALGLGLARRRR